MSGHQRRYLLRTNKHALYLSGLIGTTHPTFYSGVATPTGAGATHNRAQITGRKADQWIICVETGHENLAHFTIRNEVPSSRCNNLYHDPLVDDHPLHRGTFIGDIAQICRGITLQAGDATICIFLPKRREQSPATHCSFGKTQGLAHLIGCIQNDFQIIWRAGIGRCAYIHGGTDLQFGLPGTCGQNRCANRARPAFKNHPSRG